MARKQTTRSSGQIVPKGTDKFLVRVFLGRDATGKRKYTSETVQGTRKDAEKALHRLLVGAEEQTVVQKSKRTLGEHLKTWLDSRADISPKTLMDYRHRMAKDVIPFLGKKPLSGISREMLQALVTTLQDARSLSPRTIKYTFTVLKSALEDAVIDNVLARNPAQHVKLPQADHDEPDVLTPAEMRQLLTKSAEGDVQKHALWTLLLTAGVRPQEALALKWTDINEETSTIVILRALKQVDKSKWEVGKVKTKKGVRTIPVPQETLQALASHRARQAAEILRAGQRYSRQGFVFANRKHNLGNHLDIGTVRRWWKAALAEAGIPEKKLYASRHSHITAVLASGANPKVAQERAGHANVNITLGTYTHVLPGQQEQASRDIGTLLFCTGT